MVTKYTDAKDILELYKRAELFFINREVVLLDQPRVYVSVSSMSHRCSEEVDKHV